MVRFIGDVHGKSFDYQRLIQDCEESIQVGDMGLGFSKNDDKEMFNGVDTNKHFFIRGNHDNPALCEIQVNHIESGQSDDHGIFFVNGGWSIDGPGCPWCPSYVNPEFKPRRTEGLNWWVDEEHSQGDLDRLIDEYEKCKPRRVVTHEGPITATREMFHPSGEWNSRTATALETMFKIHKPDIWIFGHWHLPRDTFIEGTRFICLEELGYVDID